MQVGEQDRGFYEDDGALNSSAARGRVFDRLQCFPDGMEQLCLTQVQRATLADPAMPAMQPTHLLMLKYSSERGIGFHRDNSENDGAGDFPVVSLSIGNSATF